MRQLRVYLAGPEVFLPDPHRIATEKRRVCAAHGFLGVFPLDADLDLSGLTLREQAMAISRANEELIRTCDLLVANMTPFRGPSADVGTAYEMGFARALGLPVFAYTNVASDFIERVSASIEGGVRRRADGVLVDECSMAIEPFGLADNLMLEGAIEHSGGALHKHSAASARHFTDLTSFAACLRSALGTIGRRSGVGGRTETHGVTA